MAVYTWLFVMPIGLAVCAFIERADNKTRQAREDLERNQRMDRLDRAAAHLTNCDPFAELDTQWCAELGIDFTRNAPSSVPMRPFDPAPHTFPRRPARHGSHNRLHRGF